MIELSRKAFKMIPRRSAASALSLSFLGSQIAESWASRGAAR
jgi:hypothetical protein